MHQTNHNDERCRQRIIYIHGFNSSPKSHKAQVFSRYCAQNYAHINVESPPLSFDPQLAIAQLEQLIVSAQNEVILLVGSSLGGYYATYLAEKYSLKAALINPAVALCQHLDNEFIGPHTNYHTGEQYELKRQHVDYLATLEITQLEHPENILVMLQTGDEILDYRLAVDYYQGSIVQIQEGGDHSFKGFDSVLPELINFAGLSGNTNQVCSKTSTI